MRSMFVWDMHQTGNHSQCGDDCEIARRGAAERAARAGDDGRPPLPPDVVAHDKAYLEGYAQGKRDYQPGGFRDPRAGDDSLREAAKAYLDNDGSNGTFDAHNLIAARAALRAALANPASADWTNADEQADTLRVLHEAMPDDFAPAPAIDRDSLDAAWAEAEAALPEGWWLLVTRYRDSDPGLANGRYGAEASPYDLGGDGEEGIGPTPAAALRSLAATLRADR